MSREDNSNASVSSQLLVCGAVMVMPLVYAAVLVGLHLGGVLPEAGFLENRRAGAPMIGLAFLAAGIGISLSSILFKKVMIQNFDGPVDANRRFQTVLVAMAMSESGAVLGFVYMLMTGQVLYAALLGGISFAVSCFHFPSRHWLLEGDQ